MSGKARTILIVVGVLIVVIVAVPFLIPVSHFRPTIEKQASAALGRKVDVGNLRLSLLSGSLSAENLSIADDPKFSKSPFLTAQSVKVGVEMIPLIFSKVLKVTGVTIEHPQVTLIRNPTGRWNYSSLGESLAKAQSAKNTSTSDLSIQKLTLKDGEIIVASTNSERRSIYEHVNVTASGVSPNSRFPVTVSADLPGGGKFKLDGNVGPIDETDADLTPVDAKLTVESLNLATTGFIDPSAGLGGILDLDAHLVPQNGEAETKGTAKLSKALLVAGGSPASEPVTVDFNARYDLRKDTGVLHPSTLKIGNATAQLSGTFTGAGDSTVVNMKIEGQNMPAKDLEAFLPALGIHVPKGASIQGGTLSANLTLSGPTNKLVTTGNVGLYSAKLVGFDLGSKMSAISALTGVQTGKDLNIEKLTTNLRITPAGLRAENFLAVVPALGNLVGAGTVDSRNNLDFKMAATLKNAVGVAGSSASSAANLLSQITGGGGSTAGGCKSDITVPFLVKGTTADPQFVPDVGGIAAGFLKSQLGCAGRAVPGTNLGQTPADPLSGLTGLFKKPKP